MMLIQCGCAGGQTALITLKHGGIAAFSWSSVQLTPAGIRGSTFYISSSYLRKEESNSLGPCLTPANSRFQNAFFQHASGHIPNSATLEQTACHRMTNGLLMSPPNTQ